MKLLYCNICKDVIGVTPKLRSCFCGRSKAVYDRRIFKEVYSGPSLLIGILDNETLNLNERLDENGFYKGQWVTIPSKASTIVKVNNAARYTLKELRGP